MARQEGVGRVIYLGGLGENPRSEHLRSRRETAGQLEAHGPPLTYFRAGMVVGSGSESYRTLRYLVERLPAMIAPAWLATRTQPIGIDDVLSYLSQAPHVQASAGRELQIGGPDVLTYGDMLDVMALALGKRPRLKIPVPFITPWLSSLWIGLVTPVDAGVARPLIEGLSTETVVTEDSARRLFDVEARCVRGHIAPGPRRGQGCSTAGVVARRPHADRSRRKASRLANRVSAEKLRARCPSERRAGACPADPHADQSGQRGDLLAHVAEPLLADRGEHDDARHELVERVGDLAQRGFCAEIGDPPAVLSQGESEAQQPKVVSLAGRTREHGARAHAVPPAPTQGAKPPAEHVAREVLVGDGRLPPPPNARRAGAGTAGSPRTAQTGARKL